jgi:peptidoglycan/LPS O-acetylase OafA/YrhL
MAFVPCFLSGVLCFALLRGGGDAKLPSWCWLVAIPSIAAIAWFLGVRGADNSFVFEAHPWLQWGPCVALAVAIPLIRELPDVALTRSAKVVAKYSYGIYLLHIPALAIGLVALRGAPVWIQWTACAGMLVLLPLLAYRAIEGPGIDLGKYLADRWSHGRDRVAPEVDAADVPAP